MQWKNRKWYTSICYWLSLRSTAKRKAWTANSRTTKSSVFPPSRFIGAEEHRQAIFALALAFLAATNRNPKPLWKKLVYARFQISTFPKNHKATWMEEAEGIFVFLRFINSLNRKRSSYKTLIAKVSLVTGVTLVSVRTRDVTWRWPGLLICGSEGW